MYLDTKPFELSIWEDSISNEGEKQLFKLFTIASDTMDSPIKAYNISLNRKVNGEVILTFSVNARYFDEETEEFEANPLIPYLVNERTVKLKRIKEDKIEWYDFAIKDVQQDSSNQVYTYTAKDQYVQELAKNGFSLEFDKELENNTDTAVNLAEKVLEGTDWKVDEAASDFLLEFKEEPVYKCITNSGIQATLVGEEKTINLPPNSLIYVPYSMIQNKTEKFFQFISREQPMTDDIPEQDDENVLLHTIYKNYYLDAEWDETENFPDFVNNMVLLPDVRGRCLSINVENTYDKHLDQYVTKYTREEVDENGETITKDYYGFAKTEYLTPETVTEIITNGHDFKSTSGWLPAKTPELPTGGRPELIYDPPISEWPEKVEVSGNFPQITVRLWQGYAIMNTGFRDNSSFINGISKGEAYIFAIKGNWPSGNISIKVSEYTISDGYYTPSGSSYFNDKIEWSGGSELVEKVVYCQETLSKEQMKDKKIGIFITFNGPTPDKNWGFEQISFYRAIKKTNEIDYFKPGEITTDGNELIRQEYYYYDPDVEVRPTKIEEVVNLNLNFPNEDFSFKPVYNLSSEKKRAITGKETNRFDLLQKICESFECWLRLNIEHNDDGVVTSKSVSLHEYTGDYNYAGFKYGVNLKGIKRQLDSNQLVTKMIVKNNSNEFAKNGVCSIIRAPSNPSGTNVVYDFGYYEHQGLCSMATPLYAVDGGLYPTLKAFSDELLLLTEQRVALDSTRMQLEAIVETEQLRKDSAAEEEVEAREDLLATTGFTLKQFLGEGLASITEEDRKNYDSWAKSNTVLNYLTKIYHLQSEQSEAQKILDDTEPELKNIKDQIKKLDEKIETLTNEKEKVEKDFFNKYSRYIQEGFWISEDYTDDERYYLDSLSTLYTSSRPKITYTIDVFDMSQNEDYENYVFQIGDKTYVEDPEFFGWKDSVVEDLESMTEYTIRTPRQEEVIISEITEGIDDPTKNTIKVQNYKTQFDDLFQRIAATTEQLQYNTGRYERSTKMVEDDGSLSHQALQEAIDRNGLTIARAGTQSVSCDERGIITIDQKVPSKQVRIIGGGLYVTNDGGETWRTGVSGDGINADVITTGQLNAGEINIVTGDVQTHRWDSKGITAYKTNYRISDGVIVGSDSRNFVRFDEFGLYGIEGNADFNARETSNGKHGINKIEAESQFSLTQNGVTIGGLNGLVARKNILTIGGTNGLVATSDSLTIGNYFKVENGVLSISGWNIGDGYFSNNNESMWMAANGYSKDTNDDKKYVFYANNNFKVDTTGKMYASGGEIGGWTIAEDKLYSQVKVDTTTYTAMMARYDSESTPSQRGAFSIAVQEDGDAEPTWPFVVKYDGSLYATKGTIGGMNIMKEALYSTADPIKESDGTVTYRAYVQKFLNAANTRSAFLIERRVGDTITYPFWVKYDGSLKATKGTIGGWTINETSLSNGNSSASNQIKLSTSAFTGAINGNQVDNLCLQAGPNFGVTTQGKMYASGADISGKVALSTGSSIGNLKTDSNSIFFGSWDSPIAPKVFMSSGSSNSYKIAGMTKSGWVFGAGSNFGVLADGGLVCNEIYLATGDQNYVCLSYAGIKYYTNEGPMEKPWDQIL